MRIIDEKETDAAEAVGPNAPLPDPEAAPPAGGAEGALDERTLRCLRLFQEDPAGLPAFRSVEELLKEAAAWPTLLEVYRQRCEIIASRAERALLYGRMGFILETRLSRPDEAALSYRRALEEHPGDADVRHRLERLLEADGRWEALADLLAAIAPRLKSAGDRVSVLIRLAELNETKLDRPDAAIAACEQALEGDPRGDKTFDALCGLLERLGREALLAEHLEARANQAPDGAALLERAAALYTGALSGTPNARDRAIRCHERVLALAGDGEGAARSVAALIDLYRRGERWEPLASLLERAAAEAEGPEGEAAARERAELLEHRIQDPARALAARRLLLDRCPGDPETLDAAERLSRAVGDRGTLAEVLGLRERAGLFENDSEAIAACEERAGILEELGGREEEAAAALEAVLARDPARATALTRLCELYDRLDRPRDRARKLLHLADALSPETSDLERGAAWREAGQALEAVGDADSAIDAYRKARKLLPDDPFILARLQDNHAERGEIAEARETAAAELALLCGDALDRPGPDPGREAVLLERVAGWATVLSRTDEAIGCWEALLSRDATNRAALRALAALYEKTGDDEGLLSVVVKASQLEEVAATKLVLLVRAAGLYESSCDDPEEAVALYEEALAIDPSAPPALEGLQRLYPVLDRWEALADLLGTRAALAEGPERVEILVERARVLEGRLGDDTGAAASLEEALAEAPDRLDALHALADLYRKSEQWAALEGLLAREAALSGEAARRAQLAEARAELWETQLEDPERAAALWEEVLAVSPDNDRARQQLRAHHERAGRWADVARLLEEELARGAEPGRAHELDIALGEIWEEKLGRPEKALDHYRAAVIARPGDADGRQRLHRALARSEAWDELVGLLREEAETDRETSPYGWGDALVEIARIHEDALDDSTAAEAVLREVLARVPEHAGAQTRLFRRLEARGDLEALGSLVESSIAMCEDADQKIALAGEALRLALARETAGNPDAERTIAACRRLMALGGEDDDVLRVLGARLETAGRFKELLDVLSRRLTTAEGREARLDVALRLAALWEERFHRPDQALALYRQARQMDPASLPALRGMARLCEAEERWEELLGVLEGLAEEEADPRARAAATHRIGVVLHARFGRDHDAMGHLERALALDPCNEDARDLLESLALTHHLHRTLARILRSRIDSPTTGTRDGNGSSFAAARRARLCERLGDLLADELKEPGEAAEAYREALAAPQDRTARCRVALKLEAIYGALGDRKALADLYPGLLADLGEPADAEARREAAAVWARYGDHLSAGGDARSDDAAAAGAYGRAAELDPDGAIRFEERRRLLARLGAHADLAAHIERRAGRAPDDGSAAELWTAAGNAWESDGKRADAERAYARALEAAPGDAGAHAALARLLDRQGRKEDIAALHERRIPLARSAGEERSLRLEAAGILRDLPGCAARALVHYRRALDLGAPEPPLLRAVADLALLGGDAAGAVEALERYLEMAPPREDLVFTLSTLARLWEESLGRTGRAVEYCRMWVEADPASEDGQDRLERLLETREEWRELARLIESRATGRGADATARLRRLARLYQDRLRDPEAALDAWRRVLAVEPDAPDALNAVADGAPSLGRWREAAAALDRLITATPDPAPRGCLRRRQADLLAPHPAERPRAIEQLYALLEEGAAGEQAATARPILRDLLEKEGRFEEARRLVAEMIGEARPEEKPALQAALGEILEQRLWRFEDAVEAYEAWLELEPESIECLHRLQALHRRLSRWADLGAMLRREREAPIGDERRLSLTLELASIEEERLGAPAPAAAEYERALEISPDHLDALRHLQRIYGSLGDHAALHGALGRELALSPPAGRAEDLCLERARLEAGPLGRPEDAIASFELASGPAPGAAPVLDELAALLARLGRHEEHLEALGRLAEATPDARGRSAVFARMGEACEKAGERKRAIACFEQSVSLEPAMAPSLAALRGLYARESDFTGAAASLERLVACTSDGRDAAAFAAELGGIYRERLRDPAAAEAWYERAIALDAGCREAHARLGEIRFERGDFESARSHLARALALEEEPRERRRTADLALKLGLSNEKLGDGDAAIRALTKAVRLVKGLTEAWQALGALYLAAEEWASARDALTRVANARGIAPAARTAALHGIARAEQALGRPETGLVAVEGALAQAPERFDLRGLRAEFLTALARGREAAAAWREAALAAPDAQARAEALCRGAAILDSIDDEKPRALGWYREALSAHPDHPGALRRLADHALAAGAWRDAGAYLESLTGLRDDAGDQTDLGRVWWEGFGEEQQALNCLRRAIDLPGDGLEAVNLAVAICDARENWPRLAGFVEAYRERETPSPRQLPLLARLAEVYAGKLYEPEAAANTLRAMVALAPEDEGLREKLAAILSGSAETYDEALEVYRSVIATAPLRVSAWRGLAGLYWFQRREAGCRGAATVLRLLGGEADKAWGIDFGDSSATGTPATWRERFLESGPLREALACPPLLATLIEALQGAWPLLLPGPPEDARATVLGTRQAVLDEALARWGLPDVQVLSLAPPGEPLVVLGGARIAIGAREGAIAKLAEPVWRFVCERVAAQIALEHGPAGLGAPGLGAALSALRKAAGLEEGAAARREGPLDRQVQAVVHWRNRRRVRKALEEAAALDAGALERLAAAHARAADRAALLAGGDPTSALFGAAAIERGNPEIAPGRVSLGDVIATSRAARDLLLFIAGEGYLGAVEAASSRQAGETRGGASDAR